MLLGKGIIAHTVKQCKYVFYICTYFDKGILQIVGFIKSEPLHVLQRWIVFKERTVGKLTRAVE